MNISFQITGPRRTTTTTDNGTARVDTSWHHDKVEGTLSFHPASDAACAALIEKLDGCEPHAYGNSKWITGSFAPGVNVTVFLPAGYEAHPTAPIPAHDGNA